jgi:RNA polymerase sigma-70 factor (ECF subfamily)
MGAADDDAILAERIATGDDRRAEEALCRRWLPRVRAYGRLHVGAESAPDMAQEVLVVVIRSLRERRVTEPHRLSAYVSGVCRNVSRAWKRGERRRNGLVALFGASWSDAVVAPPSVERGRLVDCLRKLGARDRAVVVLTYYADHDGEEIARELEMTPGNVRVTRHRALKQLLQCIGGES